MIRGRNEDGLRVEPGRPDALLGVGENVQPQHRDRKERDRGRRRELHRQRVAEQRGPCAGNTPVSETLASHGVNACASYRADTLSRSLFGSDVALKKYGAAKSGKPTSFIRRL